MLELDVATELDATADEVWRVLTDLPRYAAWNPFIRRAAGEVRAGARICVRPRTSFGLPLRFTPTITTCEPPHTLRWYGQLGAARLASGDHRFTVLPIGRGRVRLVQHMIFDGAIVRGALGRLLGPRILRESRRGFAAMNDALGAEVRA